MNTLKMNSMKNRFLLSALCFFIVFISCKHKSNNIEKYSFEIVTEIGVNEARTEEKKPYQFSYIRSIDCDAEGNIYVLDSKDVCVKVFDQNGNFLRRMFREGEGPNELSNPYRVFFNEFTNHLFVLHEHGYHVKEFDISGNFIKGYRLPEQFTQFADFIDRNRLLYISKGVYGEDSYSNFKILSLDTLRIEQEWADTTRNIIENNYQRFLTKDGILWTCPGDLMELVGYDIESKKKINTIPIEEEYKKSELYINQQGGAGYMILQIYNFAQPLLVQNSIHVLVTKQELISDNDKWIGYPKSRSVNLYRLQESQLIKILELPELGFFIDYHTMWRNRLILSSSGFDEYPRIVILETHLTK